MAVYEGAIPLNTPRSPGHPRPLPFQSLHYPGDGLHFITCPNGHIAYLGTPESRAQAFCCRHKTSPTYTPRQQQTPGLPATRLSLGPVLLYAQMFVVDQTNLPSLEAAFEQAYPGTPPPIPMNKRDLLSGFASNIYPLVPDTRKRSAGLWKDLLDHGLGRMAEVIALAAQDKAYRETTGSPAPHQARRLLQDLVTSQGNPVRCSARLPHVSSRARRGGCHE